MFGNTPLDIVPTVNVDEPLICKLTKTGQGYVSRFTPNSRDLTSRFSNHQLHLRDQECQENYTVRFGGSSLTFF